MRNKESDLAREVRRLRREIEGLRAEVSLWRTRYFDLLAGTRGNVLPESVSPTRRDLGVRGQRSGRDPLAQSRSKFKG